GEARDRLQFVHVAEIVVLRGNRAKVQLLEVLEPKCKHVFVRLDGNPASRSLTLEIETHDPGAGVVRSNPGEFLVELDPAPAAIREVSSQRCNDARRRRQVEVVVPTLGEDL